ncbi:hypothetical protein GGC63_003702 [Paenibacillus sp. OAS669]|nr:hypothetical protein [Paenibacillus sp. OAS669]
MCNISKYDRYILEVKLNIEFSYITVNILNGGQVTGRVLIVIYPTGRIIVY